MFIWGNFLRQMSKIELSLLPSHPDRLGGLGFLTNTFRVLTFFAAAHGALLAGYLGSRVITLGLPLTQFKAEIGIMVLFVLCVTLGPLFVFIRQLAGAKRLGIREYGHLSMQYSREFDAKWIWSNNREVVSLLGSADIQSLADMGNSYDMVTRMRTLPVTREAVVSLTVATLLPISPFVFTVVPADEFVKKLLSMLV